MTTCKDLIDRIGVNSADRAIKISKRCSNVSVRLEKAAIDINKLEALVVDLEDSLTRCENAIYDIEEYASDIGV